MMKRVISLLIGTLAFSALADTNSTSLFSGNELAFDVGGTYSSAKAFGASLGINYYLTKNFGIDLWTSKNNFDQKGKFFENANAEFLFRVPLTTVFAPYLVGGVNYEVDSKLYSPIAGLGMEYKITSKFGFFGEGVYNFGTFDSWKLPDVKSPEVRAGIRLSF